MFSVASHYTGKVQVTCACHPHGDFLVTRPGLAVTPRDMLNMAERGIPVSAQNSDMFFDGHTNPSWDVPLDARRGTDIAEMWEFRQTVKNKVRFNYKHNTKTE